MLQPPAKTIEVLALVFLGVVLGYILRKLHERKIFQRGAAMNRVLDRQQRTDRITKAALMRLGPTKWRPNQ